MKFQKTFLRYTAIAALVAGGLGATAVQAQNLTPAGPIKINGAIVVNISEVGPPTTDFSCKITGQGRIADANGGVIVIESVQALNHAANGTSTLCSTVNMYDLPWTLTVVGGTATLAGVNFDSPIVPGDGCEGSIVGDWQQDATPLPSSLAPSFSRMVVDTQTAMLPSSPTCYIEKMVIKVSRDVGPTL